MQGCDCRRSCRQGRKLELMQASTAHTTVPKSTRLLLNCNVLQRGRLAFAPPPRHLQSWWRRAAAVRRANAVQYSKSGQSSLMVLSGTKHTNGLCSHARRCILSYRFWIITSWTESLSLQDDLDQFRAGQDRAYATVTTATPFVILQSLHDFLLICPCPGGSSPRIEGFPA